MRLRMAWALMAVICLLLQLKMSDVSTQAGGTSTTTTTIVVDPSANPPPSYTGGWLSALIPTSIANATGKVLEHRPYQVKPLYEP
ncbi:hypothetical protein BCR34DRAFT_34156 [Clohesyomyces aquaticus]|uniref:Uncharacterized protein n=1 Tax=Clohesyomyces aquaticus TaxID=1231657 RepID=A0A1Y1Z8U0_9PLEO|nr:hypothetical protein BCR34DRAFT_34156 [Clohesyomyces aquaticus]